MRKYIIHMHRYTYSCADIHILAQIHEPEHKRRYTYTCIDTRAHASICAHLSRYTYTYVNTYTHAYMQTHGIAAGLYPEIFIFFTTATRIAQKKKIWTHMEAAKLQISAAVCMTKFPETYRR